MKYCFSHLEPEYFSDMMIPAYTYQPEFSSPGLHLVTMHPNTLRLESNHTSLKIQAKQTNNHFVNVPDLSRHKTTLLINDVMPLLHCASFDSHPKEDPSLSILYLAYVSHHPNFYNTSGILYNYHRLLLCETMVISNDRPLI